jgi:hypothetical protein
MHTNRRYFAGVSVLVIAAIVILMAPVVRAQVTTAALSGTVSDATGAVVPKANVILTDEASGNVRRTVTNGEGYFAFAAVPPASYSVRVEMEGFKAWEAKGVVLNASDKRAITGIKLEMGATTEVVTVEASAAQITPIDSGEKSNLITEKILQNVAIVGQNAAEFVKIMPGMAYTGGTLNTSSYAAQDERTGNGPVGNFAPNGLRVAALDITSDGAHIIDPGCNCGQAMNTNADMTSEVKVMTSNFGADNSKGPVVISAIGKSGGTQYHGEAYIYSRYYSLNANDWLYNSKGNYPNGKQVLPRPETKYFYPGFNIGGPVVIPGTNFNHDRNKMFFFFGTEYYKQNVDNGVYQAVVPTQQMRDGDFTQLISNPVDNTGCPANVNNCYVHYLNGGAVTNVPNGNGFTNGILTGTASSNGLALMNTYPLDNLDPSLAAAQGFNYVNGQTRYSNMFQIRGRVDYNFTDSTKLYVTYNRQRDDAQESLDTLWTGNGQSWASPTTPYPTPLIEKTQSDVITANLTKVFSPTLTNELVFSYTYLNLPNHFADPSKVNRAGLGLDYTMLFSHTNEDKLIFPQLTGWGNGISNQLNTGFELGGVVYAKKTLPSIADNVTKVWGTHTTKLGFYWERTWNSQPGNGNVNGTAIFSNWGSNGTGNAYADMLLGQTTQYNELNYNVVPEFRYLSEEFYGQDSWKVSRRLTLEYGLRVSHLGPWVDTTGYGFAAWHPDQYAQDIGGSVNGATFPGIQWHKVNSSTPLSGSASRLFFYNPRVGAAWDIFGTGATVLRGGYGMYRYHDEQNVQNPAYGIVRGSFTSPTLWSPRIDNLGTAAAAAPSGVNALDPHDSAQPRTQSYSVTLAQRMPWKSVLEVAYVGSKSDYLSNYNNNFDQINDINVGGLFAANPWMPQCWPDDNAHDGGACAASGANTGYSDGTVANTRPLHSGPCVDANNCLGTLKIIDHKMYSNYNSMQVSWNKQAGAFTFMANYTWSKALGIRGENGAATGDPTNLRNNYGTLNNNRAQIFNIAYVYQTPKVASSNAFLKALANNWQVSGIAQYQTGADLQAAVAAYNFNYIGFIPAGTTFMGRTIDQAIQASAQNTLGSPDLTLMPKVICDPRTGLKAHQYVNGACFSPTVTPGEQGTYVFPNMTGPGFFNTDLTLFKDFTFGTSESKKLRFQFSGYNFLNHPLRTFIKNDPGLNLSFDANGNQIANGGTTFGVANNKTGHRILQMAVKFSW